MIHHRIVKRRMRTWMMRARSNQNLSQDASIPTTDLVLQMVNYQGRPSKDIKERRQGQEIEETHTSKSRLDRDEKATCLIWCLMMSTWSNLRMRSTVLKSLGKPEIKTGDWQEWGKKRKKLLKLLQRIEVDRSKEGRASIEKILTTLKDRDSKLIDNAKE